MVVGSRATESGEIMVVDLEEMNVTERIRGHKGAVWTCDWCDDGRRLPSGGQDGTIRVWHPASGEEALRLPAHSAAVWSLDVDKTGVLVSVGADGIVRSWGNDMNARME